MNRIILQTARIYSGVPGKVLGWRSAVGSRCKFNRSVVYIEAGRYTDIVFPSIGCRFIALNDGVDTIHKNNEMLVILKNVMNEM